LPGRGRDIEKQPSLNVLDFTTTKVATAAKAPSTYRLIDHQGADVPIRLQTRVQASQSSNPSRNIETGERSTVTLETPLQAGSYDPRASVPTIQDHQVYTRARDISGNSYEPYQGNDPAPNKEGFQLGFDQQTHGLPTVGIRSNAVRSSPLRVQGRQTFQGVDNGARGPTVDSASKFVKW
jgi:hypothetical protein